MRNYLSILVVLLMFGCGNGQNQQTITTESTNSIILVDRDTIQPPIRSDSTSVIWFDKFIEQVSSYEFWKDVCPDDDDKEYFEYFEYVDSARLDWTSIVRRYQQKYYPQAKQLLLGLGKVGTTHFDIFQKPRLDDIHYIDTLLSVCYLSTNWQLSSAFNRELEKYLSLPITFNETMPLFENSQGNNSEGGLMDRSSNGIFVQHTPDKKYKIYSYDDLTGGTGRNYCTYFQYLKNGKAKWLKLPDESPQIQKVYSFQYKGQTYYAIIGFQKRESFSWSEFFEVISIKNGTINSHSEFYPEDIQHDLYTIYDKRKIEECLKKDNSNIDTASINRILKEAKEQAEYFHIFSYPYDSDKIEFRNMGAILNINVDFAPETLSVSYNDVIYTGISTTEKVRTGRYKTIQRKSFRLNL